MGRTGLTRRGFIRIAALTSLAAVGGKIACRRSPMSSRSPPGLEPSGEARHWTRLEGNTVQCQLCFRNCTIREGGRGFCGVRENRRGTLYSLVYGRPCSVTPGSPMEKLALYHVVPGSLRLNLATAGCNFRCSFCHNWEIATRAPEEVESHDLSPEEAVDVAVENNLEFVAFTYTEPTIFYEYMYDIARLARNRGLRTLLNTNGAMSPDPLKELLPHLDAVNVDLKAFTSEFYQTTVSHARMEPVLTTLKVIEEQGTWCEIVNLIIPTLNDDLDRIGEMCLWIRDEMGPGVPLHFTRFFPAYKQTRLPPTPVETLEKARDIALAAGLEYVYIGNVPGHMANSTYCPECGRILIERVHFSVLGNHVQDGACQFCGHPIPGIWK